MARDLRASSERLGYLMNSAPYVEQTDHLKHHLQEFEQTGQPVKKIIDYAIQRYNGRTPVHLAASNGLWECLDILLKNGGNPNMVSSATDLCQTPLHLAATKGYAKCIQILLDHGADMELENTHRVTSLDLVRGKKNCEKVFLHAVAKVQIPSRTREQQQRVIDLHHFVEDGENLAEFYTLYEALPVDHMDLATRWTDWYQQTLLYRACTVESEDIVRYMLTKSPNQPLHNLNNEDTPLLVVCKKSNHTIARLLLNHSPKLLFLQDAHNRLSPLHVACSREDIRMVQMILDHMRLLIQRGDYNDEKQLDLDFRDNLGRTPFFNACYYGYTEIVKILVDFQAEYSCAVTFNINAALKQTQRTPLHAAVRKGGSDIVRLLLKSKDIEVNVEARPSSKTHQRLIRVVQKKLHGRILPSQESVDEGRGSSSPERPIRYSAPKSPPTSFLEPHTPVTGGTLSLTATSPGSTGAIDDGIGRLRSTTTPKRSTPEPQERRTAFTSWPSVPEHQSVKKRSSTEATGTGESSIGVFENNSGRLQVLLLSEGSRQKSFEQLLVTPLAEACAYGYSEIMSSLLQHGAQDDSGLASRIAHLVQRPELTQLLLAYHCRLAERKGEQRKPTEFAKTVGLQLHWDHKRLPVVHGPWLSDGAFFYPPKRPDSDDVPDTGYSSRSSRHYHRLARPLSLAEADYTTITVIHLEHNHLETVPLELFMLPNLSSVDLSYNKLSKLPEKEHYLPANLCGWVCTELEELNFSHNVLVKIPSCVWALPGLKRLLASYNNLETVLPERGKEVSEELLSESLETIDLSHNQLNVLPRFVFEFPSLKRVLLYHNKLETLPETLWGCNTLQELIVNNNQLVSLPWCEPEDTMIASRTEKGPPDLIRQSERALTGVVQVRPKFDRNSSVFNRQASQVTLQGIKPLGGLQELSWSNYSTAGTEGCDYSSLYKLNLAHNRLEIFPEALPCLAPNLTELEVSNNTFQQIDIQFIPQSIKKFTARSCGIEKFGNCLKESLYMQVVKNCRHGNTFGLPCQHRSHPRLPCLTNLVLSGNRLRYFQLIHHPPLETGNEDPGQEENTFGFYPSVSSLDLLYPALEGLDLSGNQLRDEFNPNIGHHSHLKWIWLRRNAELLKIPMEFAYLKNTRQFTELLIEDLPSLIEPPREYQQVSLTHLLTYMRSRLRESVYYRTIKLFFIGNGERGKTTLLRRLRGMPDEKADRTTGIDIEDWVYPEQKKFSFRNARVNRNPVHFLAWDFAGQGVYHTTHQCFYSRRSLYLALFRLSDDKAGVIELEPWLRNVQLRAPGCPVIIVGTHLDLVQEPRARELERMAMEKYSDPAIYPKLVSVVSISSTRRASVFFSNNMEKLRALIYDIVCHLQLATDGYSLEHKPEMAESDPKALFQQQIPKSFLDLQDAIRQAVASYQQRGAVPIMQEEEFKRTFKDIFEDDDELNEAVYCLNLQGTLLHFEDHGLKNVYFLDPQWLAKLMANVIHPSAHEKGSPIENGVAKVTQLFNKQDIPQSLKDKYIQLLEKFEVALKINDNHVIIPSLMPDSAQFPKPPDILGDLSFSLSTHSIDAYYQPSLRRFWVSNYIPDGFWPRLVCRIATDQQIGKVLRTLVGDDTQPSQSEVSGGRDVLDWVPWKTGIAFSHRGRTLLVVKQECNEKPQGDMKSLEFKWMEGTYRVEVHVYTPEWVTLANELLACDKINYSLDNPDCLPGLATRLLVMISLHIKSLASDWFPGMFLSPTTQPAKFPTYMPCWKCFAEIGAERLQDSAKLPGLYIVKDHNPVHCFVFDDTIVPAALQRDLECPIHGKIKVNHIAPDLIFRDLQQGTYLQEENVPLKICEDAVLGKGGYGFVCKGELTLERGIKKNVALKVFLHEIEGLMEHSTIAELLELSKQPKHLLYAYREIRQEVAFLATLNHPNLTELCGVRTHPYMCLLLELAPKKSLRAMLKEYREYNMVLEPTTLKASTMQISAGLDYLHQHQVVHLDMKSPNILVWHFPSTHDSRKIRVRQAGNVWLKIADYGISQVSTGLTMRVANSPIGTPGFMAPELFENPGQEVSSEKVDVFAFGMTLYELLSMKSPFDHVPHVKRNHEVRDKQRPLLKAKETRSLVLLQDLMLMCWDHEPEERPRMSQVKGWVSSPEFERLKAEIALKDVKSISCACMCRITPENEEESIAASPAEDLGTNIRHNPEDDDVLFYSSDEDDQSAIMSGLMLRDYSDDPGPSQLNFGPQADILPSVSEDNTNVEYGENGQVVADDGQEDSVYQFLPGGKGTRVAADDDTLHHQIEPYTQIWLCGRDQRKGLLLIFTYYDGQPGSYSFSGYCSKDEVSSICPVRNFMWMGTSSGTLKVFHAPTLKSKYTGKLTMEGLPASAILDIRHVEETASVLVATVNGEVWSFYDRIVPGAGGLKIQDRIILPEMSPCYHMVKVNVQGSVEVWGTMDNNRVLLLEKSGGGSGWKKLEFESHPGDSKLRLCSFVAHANFTGKDGSMQNHVWLSYRHRSVLVCWDARTRRQRCTLNCADKLRTEDDGTFQVSTLLAHWRKVYVGTTGGTVGIFDSENRQLLNTLNWHKGKVRTLLIMPKETEPCICSEIPFPEKEWMKQTADHTNRTRRHAAHHPHLMAKQSSAFSYMNNPMFVPNHEPEAVMICSIGNGRKKYQTNQLSKLEKLKMFDKAALRTVHRRDGVNGALPTKGEDVCILAWRS